MATLLLTGPSGVGKDWVADGLKEKFPEVNYLSFDKLFNHIKECDFKGTPLWTSDYECIRNHTQRIDFETRYSEVLRMQGFDGCQNTVVQGYQLVFPDFRDPLFEVIALDPSAALMLGIYPTPEQLLKNRQTSKKQYQHKRANLEDCERVLRWHEPLFCRNPPPFQCRKYDSSDEALGVAVDFLADRFRHDSPGLSSPL